MASSFAVCFPAGFPSIMTEHSDNLVIHGICNQYPSLFSSTVVTPLLEPHQFSVFWSLWAMLTRTLGFSDFLCLLSSLMLSLKDFLLRHVTCGLLTEVKKSKMKLVPNIFILWVSLSQNQDMVKTAFLHGSFRGELISLLCPVSTG